MTSNPCENMSNHAQKSRLGFVFLATFFLLGALGACSPKYTTHGHQIDPFELEQLPIGKATTQDVLDVLGRPSFTGAFDDKKLYYVSQNMEEAVAGKPETIERAIYIFDFDADNLLAQIEIKDEKTGITVLTLDAVTPTPGDSFGLIEQVFSNLRRRNQEK